MTTVSRVSQVSHSNVAGSGDWDHRLNRLLEDLQDTVIPSDSKLGNANEYREFRMTQRTQVNDEPAQQIDEKWVEVGTTGGGTLSVGNGFGPSGGTSGGKSVAFSDNLTSSSSTSNRFQQSSSSSSTSTSRNKDGHMEYLAPANSTTVLRSGPSSPVAYDTSPKVEKKEFYSKASYTTLIKGGPELIPVTGDGFRNLDSYLPTDFRTPAPALKSSSSTTESSKRSYFSESTSGRRVEDSEALGAPMYSSTPLSARTSSREYSRDMITDNRTRSVTPPPKAAEALKTPPMIRKILQASQNTGSSSTSYSHQHSSTTNKSITQSTIGSSSRPPPVGGVPLPALTPRERIPSYDEPPERPAARYYTSTTTTEHRSDREMSPVKRFPSPQNRGGDDEPPKRLDELLATFGDHSYSQESTSTSRQYISDGSGVHKSVPYGPGIQSVQSLRQVRIDDKIQQRQIDEDAELVHRKPGGDGLMTRSVAGPPVFYPPGQIFQKTEEEALATTTDSGKGKIKAERKYKEKEKMKSKHSEKDKGGAAPVPVCLPVCCAAPCVIQ